LKKASAALNADLDEDKNENEGEVDLNKSGKSHHGQKEE